MPVGSARCSSKATQTWLRGSVQVAEDIGPNDYSVGCWVNLDSGITQNTHGFSIGGDNASSGGGLSRPGSWQFYTSTVGYKIKWRSEQGIGGDIQDPSAYTPGTWVFCVATRDHVTKIVTLYTQGVAVATFTPAANFDFSNGNGFGGAGWPVILAVDQNNNPTAQLLGNITHCWIAKRCLTAAEVLHMYQCQLAPDAAILALGTDLLSYWKLNQTSGNITNGDAGLVDHGTKGSTLTVRAGTPTWETATPFSTPTADAGGPYIACSTSPVNINGAAATPCSDTGIVWTTSGTRTFDNANILSPVYTPSVADYALGLGSVTLTLSVTGSGNPVTVQDTATLTFSVPPVANAGGTYQSSGGDPVDLLSASESNASGRLWTTAGDGTFTDPTVLIARYTPGPGDITNLGTVLTLTVNGNPPCGTDQDQAIIVIDPRSEPPRRPNTGVPERRPFRGRTKLVNAFR